ncbi:MAG: alpha/beta fold hydrolase [Calditrichaeota bacterium]|nr:alpha/beta fold hydrolase [Calditrichota bacterium]MCB0269179.1 alpha/beta fold hydrolase [Calditrichota bacterium]MCB9066971.1 alpha/beta fold hydrolase [Calditrichia bacterium]
MIRNKRDSFIQIDEDDFEELHQYYDANLVARKRFPEVFQKRPIVLSHGIARPDYLVDSVFRTLNLSLYDFSLVSDRFHYFRGIASYLRKHDFEVYHTSVSFAADVETRAEDLKKEILKIIEKTKTDKVHVIAHSMGGLDARHMIVNHDMAEKISSLTTIGTPHWGTSVADVAIQYGMDKVIGVLKTIMNFDGIRSCATESCAAFNREVEAFEAKNPIFYQTYSSHQEFNQTFLPFQIAWKILDKNEGENDGLVSLKSQRWTKMLSTEDGYRKEVPQHSFPIRADHMDQMGWWNLNEIHKAGWWNMRALSEKQKHEELIKSVYLKIAREVCGLIVSENKRR